MQVEIIVLIMNLWLLVQLFLNNAVILYIILYYFNAL